MKTNNLEKYTTEFARACGVSTIDAIKGTQYEALYMIGVRALAKTCHSDVSLSEDIINLCKARSIGALFVNGSADDYDALEDAKGFSDNRIKHLVLRGPFGYYSLETVKKIVKNEFESLCTTVKTAIELYNNNN